MLKICPTSMHSPPIGIYSATVDEMYEPYVFPQENSSHHACRRASVTNLVGAGLKFEHAFDDEFFSFNAQHFTAMDLTNTAHNYELKARPETIVALDFAMSGIGSNSCGPGLAPELRFDLKEFSCAVKIIPGNK